VKYVKTGELLRIALLLVLLVAIIVMRGHCGTTAGRLFRAFEVKPAVDGGGT
jgi:hypothetical protein